MIFNQNQKLKNVFIRFLDLSRNWSIAKKISYGYAVAIGIAIIGTTNGLLIASYYEQISQKQLRLSSQQQLLLKNLELGVTSLRIHPQKLVSVLDNTIWLEFEQNQFLDEMAAVNKHLTEVKTFIIKHSNHLIINSEDFQKLLDNYENTIKLYNQEIQDFWLTIKFNSSFSPQEMKNSQEKLLNLLKNRKFININIEFEKLSDELSLINQRAKNQEQEANVRFSNAQKLRVRIIVGSILLSTLVAAILARYTSMAIARPIKAVTNVAQKITQESNFNLRASVTINNEVGTLATSLNQLVQWIGNYTTELELAHQTLEKRVEERTLELQQAQQTLEKRVEERTLELQQALQDLKETQSQLIQTEKMSSLGEMVAGIAHEINNPVNFIYANIEYANNYFQDLLSLVTLYKEQYPSFNTAIEKKLKEIDWEYLNEDLLKLLSSIKIGAERIREIVLSLRNFSRLDEADMKEVNIHEGINNTLLILNHRLKQNIEVIKDYGELPLVECYPAQLNQVFMNIISNAIDALLETNTSANKKIIICTQNINNKYIRIGIKDNGSGIPEEIRNKLFNPFFTTKPVGKGTGLGLSISYKIIEKHYGKIEVISEIGKGTEFAIMIPIKT